VALRGGVHDRRYAQELRDRARNVPGLTLEIHGEYGQDDLSAVLSGLDAVVVPSQVREGSPIVPREALAYGVPVLAARIGGLPEVIVDGLNGLCFDPSAPDELAAILRDLVTTPDRLDALAQGARETEIRSAADHARELRGLFVRAREARTV
jgi:glycosyltransferase involved in cell wall biosynthesis